MYKIFKIYLVSCLLLVSCTNTLTEEQISKEVAAIEEVSKIVATAWNEEDIETFMAVMDKEVMVFPPEMAPINGFDAVKEVYGDYFTNYDVALKERIEEIKYFGNWAYEWYNWEGSLTPKAEGEPIIFDNKAFYIYKKQENGAWKIYRIMFNSN